MEYNLEPVLLQPTNAAMRLGISDSLLRVLVEIGALAPPVLVGPKSPRYRVTDLDRWASCS